MKPFNLLHMSKNEPDWSIIPLAICILLVLVGIGGLVGIIIIAAKSTIPLMALGWVLPTTTVAVSITAITFVGNTVEKIKKDPYNWLLPLLSIVSVGVVEFSKEYLPIENPGVKIIFEAVVAGLYLIAGILWKQEKSYGEKANYYIKKTIAVVLFLIPPVYTFCSYWIKNKFIKIDNEVWIPVGSYIGIFLIIILSAWGIQTKK